MNKYGNMTIREMQSKLGYRKAQRLFLGEMLERLLPGMGYQIPDEYWNVIAEYFTA